MSALGYQETLERLIVDVRFPPESRHGRRGIQSVDDRCPVSATKRTLDARWIYVWF